MTIRMTRFLNPTSAEKTLMKKSLNRNIEEIKMLARGVELVARGALIVIPAGIILHPAMWVALNLPKELYRLSVFHVLDKIYLPCHYDFEVYNLQMKEFIQAGEDLKNSWESQLEESLKNDEKSLSLSEKSDTYVGISRKDFFYMKMIATMTTIGLYRKFRKSFSQQDQQNKTRTI